MAFSLSRGHYIRWRNADDVPAPDGSSRPSGVPTAGEHFFLRRDIKRDLRQERETYPTAPLRYFEEAAKRLTDFRQRARANRDEDVMAEFPETFQTSSLQDRWRDSAAKIYGNWPRLISEKKQRFNAPLGVLRDRNHCSGWSKFGLATICPISK